MSLDQSTRSTVETLYVHHHAWLSGWFKRRLNNSYEALDLMQDTFMNVITSGNVAEIREPRPFLATIASRLLAHRYRRQVLETAYLEALAVLPEELMPSPEARLMAIEALQEIDNAMEGLPRVVKQAFFLAQLEGMSYAEIADRLKVSASSVKQYLTRANRQCLFALAA